MTEATARKLGVDAITRPDAGQTGDGLPLDHAASQLGEHEVGLPRYRGIHEVKLTYSFCTHHVFAVGPAKYDESLRPRLFDQARQRQRSHVLLEHAGEAHQDGARTQYFFQAPLEKIVDFSSSAQDAPDEGGGSWLHRVIRRLLVEDLLDVFFALRAGPKESTREDPFAGEVFDGWTALGRQPVIEVLTDELREPDGEISNVGRQTLRGQFGLEEAQADRRREDLAERHADEDDPPVGRQEAPPPGRGGRAFRSASALPATRPKPLARASRPRLARSPSAAVLPVRITISPCARRSSS